MAPVVAHNKPNRTQLLCRVQVECSGGEDEASCPYTSERCGVGRVSIVTSCYMVIQNVITWDSADRLCMYYGGRLASLKSPDVWNQVLNLMDHLILKHLKFYFGLRVASKEKPPM